MFCLIEKLFGEGDKIYKGDLIKKKMEEGRKVQSKSRYFLSFLIGTTIFILGFAIVYSISYFEFQRISGLQTSSAYDIFEDKLDYSIFNEGVCSDGSFEKISRDLGFQGGIIDDLEKKFGKNHEGVLARKKFYSLIELEHFEFIKLLNKQCNLDMNVIFFFYSNEEEDLGKSEEAGRYLDTVYSRNEGKVMIYSFDINLDSDLIRKLKQKYDIEFSPSILVNEEKLFTEIPNLEEFESYLK